MDLDKILESRSNFIKESMTKWVEVEKQIFPETGERKEWNSLDEIIDTLSTLGNARIERTACNHTLFPDGGGLDLYECKLSTERGCIELCFDIDDNVVYIVKPKRLIYERVENDPLWSYFRLELHEINRVFYDRENSPMKSPDGSNNHFHFMEWVVQLSSGEYIEQSEYDNLKYSEDFEEEVRILKRILKGDMIIVPKTGVYNSDAATYDARHNEMTTEEFRKYLVNNRAVFMDLYTKKHGVSPIQDPKNIYYSSIKDIY